MEKLSMDHLPHDGRHTCATLLDNAGISKTIVKKILGHFSQDITEKVYTHKTIKLTVKFLAIFRCSYITLTPANSVFAGV
jgi:integrase